jgi:hypothetical protein
MADNRQGVLDYGIQAAAASRPITLADIERSMCNNTAILIQ